MTSRREFVQTSLAATAGSTLLFSTADESSAQVPATRPAPRSAGFWPDGAKLAVSVSMQFEAGGEPETGADSPFSGNPMRIGYPDLPARTWFAYGYKEGVPRLLDLWDRHKIKVTSHMVGEAVRKNPKQAREIVDRGHEAAAHGMSWESQYAMTRDAEKAFIKAGVDAVVQATGQTPIGYNCNWLRRGVNTLSILQELGFIYHIDDLSRDEPFFVPVDGKDFLVVPYTIRCNDILLVEGRHFSTFDFAQQLKDEFDQLYSEASTKRRMMSISTHDRIGGTPQMVRVLGEFLKYAQSQPGVWFARKDEIARFAIASPDTLREL